MLKPAFIFSLLCISLSLLAQNTIQGDSWKSILDSGEGDVIFYWFPNNIALDKSKDVMDGVEHDLGMDFIAFLEEKYEVDIEVEWQKTTNFSEILDIISNAGGATFGFSSISKTKERSEVLNFSPSYFPDIAVLVSSGNLPVVLSEEQFKSTFQKLTAVTIENTTLEMGLLRLKDSLNMDFDMIYVDNGGAIIEKVEELDNAFGYSDLPNFLSSLPRAPNIKRQVFFPLKLEGLGMIYPLNSDWSTPINDYFTSPRYEIHRKNLINKYMGVTVELLIERISKSAEIGPYEEIAILIEEVELRYKDQLDSTVKAQEAQNIRNALLIGVVAMIFIIALLSIRYRLKSSASKALAIKQSEIEERSEKFEALNNEKSNLIQVLAHDLRGPVSKIMGFSELIGDEAKLNEEERMMLNSVHRSSVEITNMIGKIMDVQAIDSGERNLKIESIDIKKIVEKVLINYQERANLKKIELTNDLDEICTEVIGDKIYLPQVFENLISNALKFSHPGTKVRISSNQTNESVTISIADQGPGFSLEDKKKVFQKYQHLSAKPTAGEPSTGLGLSIVKSYVDMMGGAITFESEQGKGTTFSVKLNVA